MVATTVDQDSIGTAVLTAPHANVVSPVQLNLQQGFNF